MKKVLYFLLLIAVLLFGAVGGWTYCERVSAQRIPTPDGTGIRVAVDLDSIDYSSLVNSSKTASDGFFGSLLTSAAEFLLDAVPQETKDKIFVALVNEKQGILTELIEQSLRKQGISVQIGGLAAEMTE